MADSNNNNKSAIADALNRVAAEMQKLRDLLDQNTSQSQGDVRRNLEGIETSIDQITAEIRKLTDDGDEGRSRWRQWMARNRRMAGAGAAFAALLLAAVIFFLLPLLQPPTLNADEQKCANHIQGQIAWNAEGNTRWDKARLKRLCQDVKRPTQPGLCFSTIQEIPLQQGAAIQADWKDAVALCAGANDAQRRISCYRQQVSDGAYFRDAIDECDQRSREVTARTACQRLVQGNISVNKIKASNEDGRDTAWRQDQLELLCGDTNQPTQPLLCFDRLFHGGGPWEEIIDGKWQRAARLCAGTESVQRTAQCVISEVKKLETGEAEQGPQINDLGETPPQQSSAKQASFDIVLQACNSRDPSNSIAQCKRYVQRDIPWSVEGYTDWQPAVLAKLCGKTRAYQQPGRCFFRAVNGEIDAEGTGVSKWAYAVQLCAGANSADERLQCYQRQQDAGRDNRAAVQACQNFAED